MTKWDDVATSGTLNSIQQVLAEDPDPKIPSLTYSVQSQDLSKPNSGIQCFGDSGGSIYLQRQGKPVLAAVIHGGTGYRCVNGNATGTDVRPLKPWIEKAIAGKLVANEGIVFPDKFTDTDGVVYPYCKPKTPPDQSTDYRFGIDPSLGGPGGKCQLTL